MKRESLIYTLVFLAGVFLFVSGMTSGNAEGFNPLNNTGAKATDFTLKDLSGKEFTLSSFKGKPVLLNFWATWCPYCRKERAHLDSIYKDYREKGLIILSVSTDRSAGLVKRFLKDMPADFTVLFDSNGSVASSYNVRGLPTSFLINREGIIEHKFMGFREWTSSDSRKL
ncbi:MAG TPA: TlpA family protein disulfide reductase, partial [Nitrospirae bacterium]|nr:TlpA family protein disulfide reductase [Nitrospirota bacterium]